MDTSKRKLILQLAACLLLGLAAMLTFSRCLPPKPSVVYSMNLRDKAAVEQAVTNAIASPRAIIYVNVDWSATAAVQQEDFERFAAEWQRTRSDLPISFHCIDFTSLSADYAPITSLPGWAEANEQEGTFTFAGNGEMVWIANGRVVHAGVVRFRSPSELIHQSEHLFAGSDSRVQN